MSLNYVIKNGKKIYRGKGLEDTVVEIGDYADKMYMGSGMVSKGCGLFPAQSKMSKLQPPIKSDPSNINRPLSFAVETPLSQTDNGFDLDTVNDFKKLSIGGRKKKPKNAKLII